MAKTKEQKVAILEKLQNAFKDASSVVFVNFHGLSVSDTSEMRQNLKEKGVGYFVAKKTLIGRALKDAKFEGDVPALDGEVAVSFTDSKEDSIAPARAIYDFSKKHKENISILGGVFENRFQSKEEMESIATIPPLEVLYGQFVNVINSPIAGLAVAINAIAEKKS
ncbi:MAG: 50S ribosomal protein L10 [Candidatus Pacebacteria bacterium]|jgi:large subunit ribosomal protein L10|nr:50S ribosomal protein L10 [bacterium]MDP6527602.1 50S ribosomal protein L10 [Candidatus Paceibacterota bacterium]MDP6659545.1 50S ribosomal protein L10 [Candidatus Paceibacterota bacterium]|tara:strand:- start:3827 stop:4324 length:498 start_codon:yes stop_codon:yes gene_type:complete